MHWQYTEYISSVWCTLCFAYMTHKNQFSSYIFHYKRNICDQIQVGVGFLKDEWVY